MGTWGKLWGTYHKKPIPLPPFPQKPKRKKVKPP